MILDKFLNSKKSQKYFLEIDDNASSQTEAVEVESPKTEAKSEITKVEAEAAKAEEASKTEKAPEPKAPAAKVPTETKTISTPSTPDVAYDSPDWVKSMKDYSQPQNNILGKVATGNNFAGKYVTNNVTSSRRRPGGSLNKFKDMASKIKK